MKTKLFIVFAFCTFNLFSQINLVPNSGFETWTNSTTLSNWIIENSVAQNTTTYTEGSKSAQLSIANSTSIPKVIAQVPMSAGKTYTVKFKYKYLSANYSGQHPIALNISKNGSTTTLSSSTFATDNNWTVKETTFTPDQNLSYDLSISLFTFDGVAFNVLIDDVQVYIQGTEQYTLIPDVNFETKLIALGIDSGVADGKVLTNNVNKLTSLNLSSSAISDLTGIQDFVALKILNCYNNKLTSLDVSKNIALTSLNCKATSLSTLDLTKNITLETLDISYYPYGTSGSSPAGKFTSLDLSKNIALTTLICHNNPTTTLDLSKNLALTGLYCDANKLTSLNLSKNLNLKSLSCNYNQFTSLNPSANLALTYLSCTTNLLSSLDVSKNSSLVTLYCESNQLKTLDVSKNLNLTNLNSGSNQLPTLDVSKNLALTSLSCTSNLLTTLDVSQNLSLKSLTCNSNLLTNLDISKNLSLTELYCYENQLTNLDVSKNLALINLFCSTNKITNLTVSSQLALKELSCHSNLLTTLDISKNVALNYILCDNNNLSSLNLKNGNNTKFNISNYKGFINNPNLKCITVDDVVYSNTNWANKKDSQASYASADCSLITIILDSKFEDKLIALNIDKDGKNGSVLNTSITTLTTLDVSNSTITDLSGIEGFLALKELICVNNLFESINLSKNNALTTLYCATNPSLTCIQVADVAYSTANWTTTKDAKANFNLDCTTYTTIPDSKFEDKLIALGIDRDGKNGKVDTKSIKTITSLNVSNNFITNLTGIQDFTSLTSLSCNSNQITTLDISKNTALTSLNCSNNLLTTIDVTKNNALNTLYCTDNQLTNVDVSSNLALLYLDFERNRLTSIDVSKNIALNYFNCGQNSISTLNVTKNIRLTTLKCDGSGGTKYSNRNLTTLDVTNNTALLNLSCNNNLLKSVDLSLNKQLQYFYCYQNNISSLDLSKNIALSDLYCDYNQITALDLSTNLSLTYFSCNNNQLTSLELSKNLNLKTLSCYSNKLTKLDISKNTALTTFNCSSNELLSLNLKNGKNTLVLNQKINLTKNPDLTCILVDDLAYSNTNWANKKDTAAFFSPIDCSTVTQIPDAKFEERLIALGIDTDGKNGLVATANIATLTQLDLSNSSISNLKGIQGFAALTTLNCSGNLMSKIELSKNGALTTLNCSSNPTLTCIQVADIAYATTNWATIKDVIANFSLDCTIYTLIPDTKFEDKLIALQIDRDGKNGKVATENIASLTSLNVSSSSITDLTGIQDFVALTSLDSDSNQLTVLDVSKNVALISLYCGNNQLNSLDVSSNTVLSQLICYNNKITSLNFSKNKALSYLLASSNQLTSLDVSNNDKLFQVWCSNNKIKTLDFSKNPLLTQVLCNTNRLVSLNIKNGKNTIINTNNNGGVQFNDNPDLKCILVDDVAYADANWGTKKDITASYNTDCTLYTLIPDTHFETKLINLGIDTDGKNGKVLTSNIFLLTELNVSGSAIADLTGIEDFVSLTDLNCNSNVLTTLNVAKNLNLTSIKCASNQFKTLDISKNVGLINLDCSNNNLATLAINLNKVLTTLNSSSNQLTTLDISNNNALNSLDCSSNQLTTLDISKNNAITSLSCSSNLLKSIDVSNNTQLQSLSISKNILQLLNVTNNTKLESILCSNNVLKTLDLSKNIKITTIDCSYNKLRSLNLKNGTNTIGAGMMFVKNFTNNPDLTCIEVDDVTYSETNWKYYKDATANYNIDCYTIIPDGNFEDKLMAIGIDTDGKNGKVLTSNIRTIVSLNVSKSNISNLTGIQDFIALDNLACNGNLLTNLDVSKNLVLNKLDCSSNQLTSINTTQNVLLANFNCSSNQITILNTTTNVLLSTLYLNENKISVLDVSKNANLTHIICNNNLLTSLDISTNKKLQYINCNNNKLTFLNLKNGNSTPLYINLEIPNYKKNPDLRCIQVNDVKYAMANWVPYKDDTARFTEDCEGPIAFPSNNFTVESKGETCTDSKNGEINITATATYAYKASINGTAYPFTNNSLKVQNVVPGTYTVSITIPGEKFEQSFTIVIPKGATITGKSSVIANKITVEITEGTAPYTVFVDGIEQFETTKSSFSLETKKGSLLEVKTAKACEGIYAKDITRLDGVISAYPNPTLGSFEIEIPTLRKEVVIALYTLNGQLVSNKTYTVENGKAQLSLENQPAGVYLAKIELNTPGYLKIIKN
jgi:Leucine-rich repeat (LRR) protein